MKAAVLGLGKTIKYFNREQPRFDFSIGVNDIYKISKPEYVLTVDHKDRFLQPRLNTMMNCRPKRFFSNYSEWNDHPNYKGFDVFKRGEPLDLDATKINTSTNSAFVAVIVAFKMGAKEIILYGVDFSADHHYFKRETARQLAVQDFKKLYEELKKRGVNLYIRDPFSKLNDTIPVKRII